MPSKQKPEIIEQLEAKLGKTLKQKPLTEIMSTTTNGYAVDANGDVVGLNLFQANISDLSFLKAFPWLTHLKLSGNEITDVSPLAGLHELTALSLYENRITNLSPLAPLTALNVLDLQANQITDLSPLAPLTALTQLQLKYNQITDISPLAPLTALTELWLYNNQITDISTLAPLTALTQLWLQYNQITDISPLAPLTALTALELNNNQITDISPLAGLTALTQLSLSSNQISDLSPLAPLTALTKLRLFNNQIADISPLAGLKQLKRLDLTNNNIRQLPEAILDTRLEIKLKLESGGGLFMEGNPLESPPVEVVKQGTKAVLNYFKELEKESVRLLQCKLLIVGNGEVGKTTLMKKLIDNSFNIESIKEESTHGINIQPWKLHVPFPRTDTDTDKGTGSSTETVNLVFWDFGGQDIYHATHQFFLTKRSLYLFVWEVRREEETRSFDYWLNIVKLLSAQSPVIMVMNKADLRTKLIDEAGFKSKFPNIQAYCKISCKDNSGIPELTEEIRSNLSRMHHLRDKLPRVWVQIRDRLEQEKKKKNYIRQEEYFSICREYGLNLERAQFVSEYLHDLGVILHYRTDPLLQHTVILNPEWATEAVYKLIDTREIQENNGSFKFEDLKRYWDAKKYPHDKHPELVRLMEKFELCFNFTGTDLHFVPELQPPKDSKDSSEPFYKKVPTPPKIFDKSDKQKLLEVQPVTDGHPFYKPSRMDSVPTPIDTSVNNNQKLLEVQPVTDGFYNNSRAAKTFNESDNTRDIAQYHGSAINPHVVGFTKRFPGFRTLRFEYHYDFMPEGIVSRFMARMFYLIYENRFWKNRVELKFEDSFAHVAGEPLNRRVTIAITGSCQRELLAIIRSHFDAIHSTLNMEKNLHYHEMVPCICSKCLESETPNFYKYEKLKGALENNKTHVTCFESYIDVSVEEMLALVAPPKPKHNLIETLITALSQLLGIAGTIRTDEDSRNGFIALLLSNWGYRVKDQTRWGSSASGKSLGELDIKIENPDGRTACIIEAFILTGLNRNVIDLHLKKVFGYDPGGLPVNYILVYAEASDFQQLWESYLEYIPTIDYKYKPSDKPKEVETGFASIKMARMRHQRDGKITEVVHFFVNMFPGKR